MREAFRVEDEDPDGRMEAEGPALPPEDVDGIEVTFIFLSV